MLGWLKGLFDSHETGQESHISEATVKQADAIMAAGKEELEGLNFKSAIEAHLKWKTRLRAVIDGTSEEKLDPKVIAMDNQCVLGKWLHGTGGDKFGAYPHFKTLCAEHAQFHRSASQVLELALAKRTQQAVKELESGAYRDTSLKVTAELAQLFVALGKQ
jgi:Chemoreceptor zinc-binding domain